MLQGTFEYVWGNVSFSHTNKNKLQKFKVIQNKLMNKDFSDSMIYLLEQALGKAACKRN